MIDLSSVDFESRFDQTAFSCACESHALAPGGVFLADKSFLAFLNFSQKNKGL
jgi:hypothetical protein